MLHISSVNVITNFKDQIIYSIGQSLKINDEIYYTPYNIHGLKVLDNVICAFGKNFLIIIFDKDKAPLLFIKDCFISDVFVDDNYIKALSLNGNVYCFLIDFLKNKRIANKEDEIKVIENIGSDKTGILEKTNYILQKDAMKFNKQSLYNKNQFHSENVVYGSKNYHIEKNFNAKFLPICLQKIKKSKNFEKKIHNINSYIRLYPKKVNQIFSTNAVCAKIYNDKHYFGTWMGTISTKEKTYKMHAGTIYDISFSRNFMISCSTDRCVSIYDIHNDKEVFKCFNYSYRIFKCGFIEDKDFIHKVEDHNKTITEINIKKKLGGNLAKTNKSPVTDKKNLLEEKFVYTLATKNNLKSGIIEESKTGKDINLKNNNIFSSKNINKNVFIQDSNFEKKEFRKQNHNTDLQLEIDNFRVGNAFKNSDCRYLNSALKEKQLSHINEATPLIYFYTINEIGEITIYKNQQILFKSYVEERKICTVYVFNGEMYLGYTNGTISRLIFEKYEYIMNMETFYFSEVFKAKNFFEAIYNDCDQKKLSFYSHKSKNFNPVEIKNEQCALSNKPLELDSNFYDAKDVFVCQNYLITCDKITCSDFENFFNEFKNIHCYFLEKHKKMHTFRCKMKEKNGNNDHFFYMLKLNNNKNYSFNQNLDKTNKKILLQDFGIFLDFKPTFISISSRYMYFSRGNNLYFFENVFETKNDSEEKEIKNRGCVPCKFDKIYSEENKFVISDPKLIFAFESPITHINQKSITTTKSIYLANKTKGIKKYLLHNITASCESFICTKNGFLIFENYKIRISNESLTDIQIKDKCIYLTSRNGNIYFLNFYNNLPTISNVFQINIMDCDFNKIEITYDWKALKEYDKDKYVLYYKTIDTINIDGFITVDFNKLLRKMCLESKKQVFRQHSQFKSKNTIEPVQADLINRNKSEYIDLDENLICEIYRKEFNFKNNLVLNLHAHSNSQFSENIGSNIDNSILQSEYLIYGFRDDHIHLYTKSAKFSYYIGPKPKKYKITSDGIYFLRNGGLRKLMFQLEKKIFF
ncbi:hypothetical protein EDEG_03673 [Edhazardia aedis USNM 41457]|uniref:Uncharacterized protein n=1 Tax=Edhazardia aedis (strain USNM 41457) TaxID=1003232 RepID=J9D2N4_EDHAE|nr:hypothetical protein EDEG_03673 [Edhazardia aedis USNM 41457]|eukprot:EJW01844.1 hypothetical protein EDEG_03673 [Edhazardia aedis USNM 41457]